jgi:glutamate 5-kinase
LYTNEVMGSISEIRKGSGQVLKTAVVNESASGDRTIVAAVTGKKIVVVAYSLVVAGALTLTWKSGSTALTGPQAMAANGVSNMVSDVGTHLFETASAEALVLNLGGAVQVGGFVTYYEWS